jgi:hypothetical protein
MDGDFQTRNDVAATKVGTRKKPQRKWLRTNTSEQHL